jgi:plastocyanin
MKRFIVALAAVLALTGAVGCDDDNPVIPPGGGTSINIQSFAFVGGTITVALGTQVTWTNKDASPHTVTSDSGTELSSGSLAQNATYSHTFNTAGTFPYHCTFHSSMTGSITVTP